MRNKTVYWIPVVLLMLAGCMPMQPFQGPDHTTAKPTVFVPSPTTRIRDISSPQPTGTTVLPVAPTPNAITESFPEEHTATAAPPAIILFIGDGMGRAYRQAATWLRYGEDGMLAMDAMPVHGVAITASADSLVTDSAAAATAMATGSMTRNQYLGVNPDKGLLVSIVELAQNEGWAVGLVTTVPLTHATPAAFAVHLPNRSDTREIARQMMAKKIDVLLGGGEDDFHSRDEVGCFPGKGIQPVGMDLVSRAVEDGYVVVCTEEELLRIVDNEPNRLVGLFGAEELIAPFSPDLVEMTEAAIRILSRDPDGFFLVVEAGQIDWTGHSNDALAAMEFTLGLDNAVSYAQSFALENPDTLIIVTADHETGGMEVNKDGAGSFRQDGPFNMPDGTSFWVDWASGSHTGVRVPLTAQGPFSENLAGEFSLTKIFETMTLHLFSSRE